MNRSWALGEKRGLQVAGYGPPALWYFWKQLEPFLCGSEDWGCRPAEASRGKGGGEDENDARWAFSSRPEGPRFGFLMSVEDEDPLKGNSEEDGSEESSGFVSRTGS